MTSFPYPMLLPPPFRWNAGAASRERKVNEWIETVGPEAAETYEWDKVDIALLGVPLSRSSISPSAASEHPQAFRLAWKYFAAYDLDADVDLTELRVVDLGDVRQHVTDISRCHENIREAMRGLRTHFPHLLPLAIGGDHSITAMLVKGWRDVHSRERIGILQLDTHFDLRPLDDNGPTNGTPIRNLIESGVIRGEDVVNIGLHGFFNARSLKEYADRAGVRYVTLREARKHGVENAVSEALQALSRNVDTIYLTVDMDVLDIIHCPAAPAASPGGMRTDELFAAVHIAGKCPKVKAMDIVCLDPTKDVAGSSVKASVHTMLSFLSGFAIRKGKPQEAAIE